ncbi:putative disease resistance protein [Camellia lanceoleosa]|uniref:Disease resistance protein n=1 Tax=Camellia lanceoleosa TaxID=1840588 RepID=A0ACC0IR28_9ERIC|nr:putative disease resistance protein [Camellia lanceoleosa]
MAHLVAGALLSASFQVLFERLSSPQLLNFFKSLSHHNEGDKLRKELKSKLLRLSVVLNDAEKQQFTNQLVKDWMDELKDAIYHADDLLDEIATKALGCKVEAEFRSAVKNQVTDSTLTSDSSLYDAELVSKMEEIIDRLEWFLEEKDDLGLKEVADQKWTSAANKLALDGCDGVELGWQGVSSLVKLEISNMPNLEELTPKLYMLTNLRELIIENCPSLVSFPHTGLPLMLTSLLVKRCEALDSVNACLNTCLQKLRIENCSSLLSVGVLPITLNSISIWECPKLVFSVSEEMECRNSSLEHFPPGFFWKLRHLNIANCDILSIPNGHGLNISTSLESVYVNECNSMVSCLQEALHAPNLKTFWVENCKKLKSLPEGMHSHLPSLEYKEEDDDDVLESFLEEALLPPTLTSLRIRGLQNLKSINYQSFQHLTCLKELEIFNCPQFQSLPEEGLLASLSRL